MKLNINPGPIFICGPIKGNLNDAELLHREAEQLITSLRLEAVNVFSLFNKNSVNLDNIKYTTQQLIKCNTLVTLPFWASCEYAKKHVDVARLLNIEVVDYSKITHFKYLKNEQ